MAWWHAVVESRHDIQNPTSAEKIRRMGEVLGLNSGSQVLDMASGRGGPAIILAETFGCRVTCVERAEEFVTVARERVNAARLEHRITIHQADAREFVPEHRGYDAALCLGASFIWDGLENTTKRLREMVRPDGFVAVGEPFWRRWPLPADYQAEEGVAFRPLAETVTGFESAGVALLAAIASSDDDWDRYESLHWMALDAWLRDHPGDPDAETFRRRGQQDRDRYLRRERDLLGWVILVGRRAF
jgi:hypothetical protein